MFLSVIICTRNRCEKLHLVLNSFRTINIPDGLQWEVLIVDNGSTDETAKICKSFLSKNTQKYRYVYEGKKGKSNALNRGIREAKGDILAFTDDDCIVDSSWFKAIMDEYNSDPELKLLGGRVELYNKFDKPVSLVTSRDRIDLQVSQSQIYDVPIIGANISFKKEVYSLIGGFDVLLGPGAKSGAIAEDLDFVYRVCKKGLKAVYSPSVIVYHNHGRTTDEEIYELGYKYYAGRGSFYFKHMFSDIDVAKRAYWELRSRMINTVKTFRNGEPIQNDMRLLRAFFSGAISRLIGKLRASLN